jgi:hypothetical protein
MTRFANMSACLLFFVGCGQPDAPRNVNPPNQAERQAHTMLPRETLEEISALVRSGFYDKERLMEIFCEGRYAPGELDRDDVSAAIDSQFAQLETEKKAWPAVTDCDRLDSVFAAMNKRGIIALQNAGYTQSDGYSDFLQAYKNHPDKSSVIGYCFYHEQDLERVVRGDPLFLAFGPLDPDDEELKGPEIGRIVREELERAGLKVDWDGTFENRLSVPNLVWQRR